MFLQLAVFEESVSCGSLLRRSGHYPALIVGAKGGVPSAIAANKVECGAGSLGKKLVGGSLIVREGGRSAHDKSGTSAGSRCDANEASWLEAAEVLKHSDLAGSAGMSVDNGGARSTGPRTALVPSHLIKRLWSVELTGGNAKVNDGRVDAESGDAQPIGGGRRMMDGGRGAGCDRRRQGRGRGTAGG